MPQVDTHLLASRDGYKTFARTPSVTPQELRELEELVYGQPDDASVYAALTSQSTAMLRRFRSTGRYALSRIVQGDRDSAGRETIAVCTMIFTAAQYQVIARGDLWRMLHSAQLWAVDLFRSGQTLALPEMSPVRRTITASDVTIFDAWMAARGRQNAVAMIGANPASHQAIITLLQVLAEKDLLELTWGCRLFSLPSSISVASIAQRGVEQNSRRVVVTPSTSPTTSYGKCALALVGTNGWLTSVIAAPVVSPKPAQFVHEAASREDGAPSSWAMKKYGRQNRFLTEAGGTLLSADTYSLPDLTSKKSICYMIAGLLAILVIFGAFLLITQFQASQEVREQNVLAQGAAKTACAEGEKAVTANTSEEARAFAGAAEAAAITSRSAADSAAKANKNSGFFVVSKENDDAQKAADNAKACADQAKNTEREQAQADIVTIQKNIAIDEAKRAEEAEGLTKDAQTYQEKITSSTVADDAAKAAKIAADTAKDAIGKAGKYAVQKNLDDAQSAAQRARLAADRAKAAAEQANDTVPKQSDSPSIEPSTPEASIPAISTPVPLKPWDTKSYIDKLKKGLEKLGVCTETDIDKTIGDIQVTIDEMGKYEQGDINKQVFAGDSQVKKTEYNDLLFVFRWTLEVLDASDRIPLDKIQSIWKILTTVSQKDSRPNPECVGYIEDFFTQIVSASITDSAIKTPAGTLSPKEQANSLKNPDRCTFQYNIKAPCNNFTGDPINLDDLLKGNEFLKMPFYSVVLIFHEQFELLFDSRINIAKKIAEAKNDSKSERAEKHFPCDKLNTEILKKIETIKLEKLIVISLKIRELNLLCNDSKKSN
jgi:GTPase-associated protein 1, N-terminal domain type 2